VPVVPVVSFWSGAQSTTGEQLANIIMRRDSTYDGVVVQTGAVRAVMTALGLDRSGTQVSIGLAIAEADPEQFEQLVAGRFIGLLPLAQLTPAMRALAVDGVSLFGNDRAESLDGWPLMVTLEVPPSSWDQAQTWSLVAGGDILLDRGPAEQMTIKGKGADFAWDGGTVSVTGHHCCTAFGWPVPETKRTGHGGVVRSLFRDADLAIANMETPIRDDFTYHSGGLMFTGNPDLLDGIEHAGFDFLTLANNHIGNGGSSGIVDSVDHLDALGIAHAGAGVDLAHASAPAYLDAGGQKVAIIGCAVVGGYFASEDGWGGLRCSDAATLAAIGDARSNADVVIVFPHWGREYQSAVSKGQRKLAETWIGAGVDLVIGSHPHWAGAVETVDDHLVFYTLGNLVFDQTWSEATMEGLILELTFHGKRLVQAWLHPAFILSETQPNLLDYEGGGRGVLAKVRADSRLDY